MSDHNHEFSVSDVEYNVITTLSNLLQSEEVLMKYATDAQEAGDSELEQMFHDLRRQNGEVAERLYRKLGQLASQS
ncbi:MAG TPA: hypothetical protein VGR22_09375 [Thermomicrobiales bacterium]|nr:hypothetical protein [Thermomicrobiales bacterium]